MAKRPSRAKRLKERRIFAEHYTPRSAQLPKEKEPILPMLEPGWAVRECYLDSRGVVERDGGEQLEFYVLRIYVGKGGD